VSQREIESIINACESRSARKRKHRPSVDVLAVSAKFYLRTLLADRKLVEKFSLTISVPSWQAGLGTDTVIRA
jgi:hypothetical protein